MPALTTPIFRWLCWLILGKIHIRCTCLPQLNPRWNCNPEQKQSTTAFLASSLLHRPIESLSPCFFCVFLRSFQDPELDFTDNSCALCCILWQWDRVLLVLPIAITCRFCVFSVSFFSPYYQQKDFRGICSVVCRVAVKFPCYKEKKKRVCRFKFCFMLS